jgi:hypothetical protein
MLIGKKAAAPGEILHRFCRISHLAATLIFSIFPDFALGLLQERLAPTTKAVRGKSTKNQQLRFEKHSNAMV